MYRAMYGNDGLDSRIMQEIAADAFAGRGGSFRQGAQRATERVREIVTKRKAETDNDRLVQQIADAVVQRLGLGQFSFEGIDPESGRPIYRSNFPTGTPKSKKSERIISLIQNVWSKKPIELVVGEGETARIIRAEFDANYDDSKGAQSDARKLAGGNRHGSAKDQRVTLNLADDYYRIIEGATYNYSKDEVGKTADTHKDVREWHYFINDILYLEYEGGETEPYRVTVNVKEKDDGTFVYSVSAERETGTKKEQTAPQTLHAAIRSSENGEANSLLKISIGENEVDVNSEETGSMSAEGRMTADELTQQIAGQMPGKQRPEAGAKTSGLSVDEIQRRDAERIRLRSEQATRQMSRSAFEGTDEMQAAGIKVSGSLVPRWDNIRQLAERNKAEKSIEREYRAMLKQYNLQPSSAEKSAQLFADSEKYNSTPYGKKISKTVMNERTPERGAEIFNAYTISSHGLTAAL